MSYTSVGLTVGGGILRRPAGSGTVTTGKTGGSLPAPKYKYVNRSGKKMDAEYLIFPSPWTQLQVARSVSATERRLGLQATDTKWFKRDPRKSDVPKNTIVMQRYVPKNSMGRSTKVSQSELDANPPEHVYVRREGKKKDADFLQFRSPPWTDKLIKQTSWDEWARRVGIPAGGRGSWFKREKDDVPAGHIVYQSYTDKRVSPEGGSGNIAVGPDGQPLQQPPPYTQNNPILPGVSNTVLYAGVAGVALVAGLLLTKKK